MHNFFKYSILTFMVLVFSFFIPKGYDLIFTKNTGKTYLFYSPVLKKFIYREMTGEGHKFITRDEDGKKLTRVEYESAIPFIYYKNMEIWGKLPINIDGEKYDKRFIKGNRQVFQIKASNFSDKHSRVQIYPLLESKPDRARLSFPENSFQFSNKEMVFINSDFNEKDIELTDLFTNALKENNFKFPAKNIFGKVSILKPFDEGYFVIDSKNELFHVKKVNGKPFIKNTKIEIDSGIKYIQMNENKKREFYGLLVTNSDDVYFISYDNYSLIKIPSDGYRSDSMDIKILMNPVNNTIIFSDDSYIYGIATDKNFKAFKKYKKLMFYGKEKLSDRFFSFFFPFFLKDKANNSNYLFFNLSPTDKLGIIGSVLSLFIGVVIFNKNKKPLKYRSPDFLFIAVTGIYGLLAIILNGVEE